MSNPITAELYVTRESLTRASVDRLLDHLVALRLLQPDFRGLRTSYARLGGPDTDFREGALSDALGTLTSEGHCMVWIQLCPRAIDGPRDWFSPRLALWLNDEDGVAGWGGAHITMRQSAPAAWYPKFVALTRMVAEFLDATYGWAASDIKTEFASVSLASVAALEPQPVEWLNIYGHAYVERIGLERLLSVPPTASAEVLANGGVMVLLASTDSARNWVGTDRDEVAQHLGMPVVRPRMW